MEYVSKEALELVEKDMQRVLDTIEDVKHIESTTLPTPNGGIRRGYYVDDYLIINSLGDGCRVDIEYKAVRIVTALLKEGDNTLGKLAGRLFKAAEDEKERRERLENSAFILEELKDK
jgi:hypothetical protein